MLNYLLIFRLRESLPVLYHDLAGPYFHLFVEGKVYRVDEDYLAENSVLQRTECKELMDLWNLIDNAQYPPDGVIPRYLANGGVIPKLIFASVPQEKRWSTGRQRDFDPYVVYINPYSEAEAQLLYVAPTSIHSSQAHADLILGHFCIVLLTITDIAIHRAMREN